MARGATPVPGFSDPGLAPITDLPGVGPALALALERLGLTRIQHLWFHLPLRYEDRTRVTPIGDLRPGTSALIEGRVEAVERGFRYRPQLRVAIGDGSRATLILRFFHFRGAQMAQLAPGTRLRCYGEVRLGGNGLEIVHPQYQRLAEDEIGGVEASLTPIYPTTEGLGQKRLAGVVARALDRLPPIDELELIPADLLAPLGIADLRQALLTVHRPPPDVDRDLLAAGIHPAQRRLAFEELLAQNLILKRLRARIRSQTAPRLAGAGRLRAALIERLPFRLTGAQRRVDGEIQADLGRTQPMLRLVQGDVGSGKTIVAALAALGAVEAGQQAAVMAPTELLAEQHLRAFRGWLEPLGVTPVWLGGKVTGKARAAALEAVASGSPLVIGTHALMQEGVRFARLGLAIIDEQHRFGVDQRASLRRKGAGADLLTMTATPIPRTLALSIYGDVSLSCIRRRPRATAGVSTRVITPENLDLAYGSIRNAVAAGHQAYVICPLVDDADTGDGLGTDLDDVPESQRSRSTHVRSATSTVAELSERVFPDYVCALLTGRMSAAEKDAVMEDFRVGKVNVLVSTTVVEVGVDVPNATVMLVHDADRFGLATLHQLRGRVGRGDWPGEVWLLCAAKQGTPARKRLSALERTADGFELARLDLKLRREGEVLGYRQHGGITLRVSDLAADEDLVVAAHEDAQEIFAKDPSLASPGLRPMALEARDRFGAYFEELDKA